MGKQKQGMSTRVLVLGAILTALIVALQFMGAFVRFGPFSISLVLVPIVIGAATCGAAMGAWLGLVFGAVVLLSGDAAPFLAVNAAGTVIVVLLKGLLAGLCAGLVYRLIEPKNRFFATITSAVVCPVINTGVFLLGCLVFFLDTVAGWGAAAGFGENVTRYMLFGLVGGNFIFELLVNILLSPVIVRLLQIKRS